MNWSILLILISQPKHPWCEKSSSQEPTKKGQDPKKSRMKKMWNQIGWPRPPAVNEIKLFDNDDKAAKHSERKKRFVALSSLSKILISSTAGGLGRPIWFHIFSSQPFLVLGRYFFYTRGVLVEISLLFSYFFIRASSYKTHEISIIIELIHTNQLSFTASLKNELM